MDFVSTMLGIAATRQVKVKISHFNNVVHQGIHNMPEDVQKQLFRRGGNCVLGSITDETIDVPTFAQLSTFI